MRFLDKYPKVEYRFGNLKSTTAFTNLSVYADIIDRLKDDSSLYRLVDIRDTERPDLLADRLYSDSSLAWTFMFVNDKIRTGDWPLGYEDFQEHISEVYPGQFLTIKDTETDPDTGATVLKLVSRFKIGDTVYGSVSGAVGTVYSRNINQAQILVNVSSGTFVSDETLQDAPIGSSPNEFALINEAGLATQATHHYENASGEYVDIDPSGSVPAGLTRITLEQVYEAKNFSLQRLKVLREDAARQAASRYKEIVSN